MILRRCPAVSVLVLTVASSTAAQVSDRPKPVDFQRHVRPILADNCFQCHGPDQRTRQAKLRLDTEDGAFAERPSGRTIVPGDPKTSLLYQRIADDSDTRRMPPPRLSNKTLSAEQIEVLRRWIEEGASWDQHWSFMPVSRIDPPAVADETWVRNPIDRFVLARLEAGGLAPTPEADERTLARRVALDLTGLPPDPGTLASFLSDTSDGAFEALVDKLLESRHWGENRARYWLDAARYGDTHGIHIDNYREMYFYRDWVIDAYNDNKPFDKFTVEQIAGDLLPNPTQYAMDGNVSDPPPVLVVPRDDDRDRWHELQKLAWETDTKIDDRAAFVDESFAAWLASGQYQSLKNPLEASAALMTLRLEGDPSVEVEGIRTAVTLHEGAAIGEGPSGQPALRFGERSWAELPSLPLDSDTPFSLSLWLYHPEDEGDFVVAGQDDPDDDFRGWSMGIGGRLLTFRLTGDKPAEGEEGSVTVFPINTKRLPAGEWMHIVVTYDGSGERAGLSVYRNGEAIEVEGSEFFASVEGSVQTKRPLYLGHGVVSRDRKSTRL